MCKRMFLTGMMLIGLAWLVAGCREQKQPEQIAVAKDIVSEAVAVLHPTEGNTAHGTVRFIREGLAVKVTGEVDGLTPGKHGFHIHEMGDCSAGDASSAGGHFNPANTPHGGLMTKERHVGDMGNIIADEQGKAMIDLTDSLLSFYGPYSIIGRGLIVHGGEDDLTSQPSGNAGPRVACGVIGIAAIRPEGFKAPTVTATP